MSEHQLSAASKTAKTFVSSSEEDLRNTETPVAPLESSDVRAAYRKMLEVEAEYLHGYRNLLQNHNVLSILATRNSPEQKERREVELLRQRYDEAKIEFTQAVSDSIEARFDHMNSRESEHSVTQPDINKHRKSTILPRLAPGSDGALHFSGSGASDTAHIQSNAPAVKQHLEVTSGAPSTSHEAVVASRTTSSHESITNLLRAHGMGRYAEAKVSQVLYDPIVSPQTHNELLEVVMKTGEGPRAGETVHHFLERAQDTLAHHTSKYELSDNHLRIPLSESHVYLDTQGSSIVFGGSYGARHLIAHEYLLKNPDAHLFIVDEQGMLAYQFSLHAGVGGRHREVIGSTTRPIHIKTFVAVLPRGESAAW